MSKIKLLIVLLLSFCYTNEKTSNYLETLPRQLLFFSTIEKEKINIDTFGFKENYKVELIVNKFEKENIPNSKNTMSLYINSLYYKSIICLDHEQNNFYTLKNKIMKHISTFNYKNSDSFSELSDKNHFCQERLEYIDKNLNLHEKNSLLDNNYFYNLVNNFESLKHNQINPPLIQNLTDISFAEIHQEIINKVNKTFNWNDSWSYELFFIYDSSKNLFSLSKVFIYFIPIKFVVVKLHLRPDNYDEIQMLQKETNELITYTKSSRKFSIQSFKIDEYFFNFFSKIFTNKSTSVYHNTMEIALSIRFIRSQYEKYKIPQTEKLCYLIHEILTEDVYIEKNEFKSFVSTYFENANIEFELYASRFIEQELSSDLSQQSYFSFYFCADYNQMMKINYLIKFPIHFRYQPSLKKESLLTHQTVVMPHPFITIYKQTKDDYNTIFYDKLLYANNGKFEDEIDLKLNTIVNEVYMLKNNYIQLQNQIPAGQMKYFWPIAAVTSITSMVGFLIIFGGVITYIFEKNNSLYKDKKKI